MIKKSLHRVLLDHKRDFTLKVLFVLNNNNEKSHNNLFQKKNLRNLSYNKLFFKKMQMILCVVSSFLFLFS